MDKKDKKETKVKKSVPVSRRAGEPSNGVAEAKKMAKGKLDSDEKQGVVDYISDDNALTEKEKSAIRGGNEVVMLRQMQIEVSTLILKNMKNDLRAGKIPIKDQMDWFAKMCPIMLDKEKGMNVVMQTSIPDLLDNYNKVAQAVLKSKKR